MPKKTTKYSFAGIILTLLIAGANYFFNDSTAKNSNTSSNNQVYKTSVEQKPLTFKKERQLVLADLDHLGRAVDAHIQLKDAFEPTEERENLTYNPPGFDQVFLENKSSSGKVYKNPLWSRGHLVGYQFSGLNNEKRNLIAQTIWSNAGAYYNTDNTNINSMIYYEERLDDWLYENKSYYLDYQVTPLYQDDELVPRQVRLAYLGYDSNGKKITISLGGKEQEGNGGAKVVILDNISPNAEINYLTGEGKQK
ncbi:MAG: DNA/RNA non-specific endonuclease [Lactovum sp.]